MIFHNDIEKYQTVGARFWALLIDGFILAAVFGVLSALADSVYFASAGIDGALSIHIISSLSALASAFYYILLHFYFGQTLGKMIAGVRVLDAVSEKKISLGQSIIRQLPQLIAMIALIGIFNAARSGNSSYTQAFEVVSSVSYVIWYVADIIVCLSNEKHRALHDYIAGTIVVKTK